MHHKTGIQTHETLDEKVIFVRWFSPIHAGLFAMALVIIGTCLTLGFSDLRTERTTEAMISFGAIPVFLLIFYFPLLRVFNRSTFTLKEGLLSVTHGPLPTLLKAPKDLPFQDLRFYVDRQRNEHNVDIFQLLFFTGERGLQSQKHKILSALPQEKLNAINDQLEQWQKT